MDSKANKEFLEAVNKRLKRTLVDNTNLHSAQHELSEKQKAFLQASGRDGKAFATSLCLHFTNLKHECDAAEVRRGLENQLGVKLLVQSVQLLTAADDFSRKRGGQADRDGQLQKLAKEYHGKATVVFKDLGSVQRLLQWAEGLRAVQGPVEHRLKGVWHEVPLALAEAPEGKQAMARFRQVHMRNRMYHQDAHGVRLKCSKMQVGNKIGKDTLSVWFETGTSDKPVELEVSRMHRQLKLRLQYSGGAKHEWARYCLSAHFKTLLARMEAFVDNSLGGRHTLCLMFTLRHPPNIYKKVAASSGGSGSSHEIIPRVGSGRPAAGDRFGWVWSWPVEADNEGWKRSVDFTGELNALGTALTYRLVLEDNKQARAAIADLARCHLIEWDMLGEGPEVKPRELQVERVRYSGRVGEQGGGTEDMVSKYTAALDKFHDYFEVSWRLRSLLHRGLCFPEHLLSDPVVQLLLAHLRCGRAANVVAVLDELLDSSTPIERGVLQVLETHPVMGMEGPPAPLARTPAYCAQVLRLTLTPTRVCCLLGDCELSNRVLRKYKAVGDRFLRVSITDEAGDKLILGDDTGKELKTRIKKFLKHGVTVADRHYKFLAFSNSQIRQNSFWMFAEVQSAAQAQGLPPGARKYTCNKIRRWMGDFSRERVVAKYAARMGQCFSSSIRACPIGEALQEIDDITATTLSASGRPHAYTFSDGVGRISPEVAYEIGRRLRELRLYTGSLQPCAFQIRMQGYKGMLVRWGDVPGPQGMQAQGRTIQVRPSMRKFDSAHGDLEVVGWSRFIPGHLNRQIIVLLEDRGVVPRTFLGLQHEYTARLDAMLHDGSKAVALLADLGWDERCSCLGAVKDMLHAGFTVMEPFIQGCLQALKGYVLKSLKDKARIHVQQAANLYGVMDELGILEYGQVYISYQRPSDRSMTVVTGKVVVTKNPCHFPGDILKLQARDVPQFRQLNMTNVVVFPQKGRRPHPSEASGSDLDGDQYFCCWDQRIVDFVTPAAPYHYMGDMPRRKERGVEVGDILAFFYDMMENGDLLGRVSNAWLAFADKEDMGPSSERCKLLAEKCSKVVDFPKTGVPVKMDARDIPFDFPHFMNKKDKASYHSTKALGQLYDDASKKYSSSIGAAFEAELDHSLVLQGRCLDQELWGSCLATAGRCQLEYENQLIKLMNRFEIYSESELVCGCVLKAGPARKHARAIGELRDQVLQQVQLLWLHFRKHFDELTAHEAAASGLPLDEYRLVMASAWYFTTYDPALRQHPQVLMLSFPWVVHRELCTLKSRWRNRGM